jgi:hypothetical protein
VTFTHAGGPALTYAGPDMGIRFSAEVSVVASSAGGRRGPIASDYRSLLRTMSSDDLYDVLISWVTADRVAPGQTGVANCWVPSTTIPMLATGAAFEVLEGPRKVVATGRVIAIEA